MFLIVEHRRIDTKIVHSVWRILKNSALMYVDRTWKSPILCAYNNLW